MPNMNNLSTGPFNIGRSNWTLPFRVWKKGQPHPYPNSLHATIKRPHGCVSGITFNQVSSMFGEWLKNGLHSIEPKVLTIDQAFGKDRFSAQIDLALLRYPGSVMMNKEEANPFKAPLRMACVNWFLFIYSAFDTGHFRPEKTEFKDFGDIPEITTKTIWWENIEQGASYSKRDLLCTFDWADTFLLFALYEVAKEAGRQDDYKKVAGQFRMASDARLSSLDDVYDASHILGLTGVFEYEKIFVSISDIKPFMPDLMRWSGQGKISLTEALDQLRNKYRKERFEAFAIIKAACEAAGTEDRT